MDSNETLSKTDLKIDDDKQLEATTEQNVDERLDSSPLSETKHRNSRTSSHRLSRSQSPSPRLMNEQPTTNATEVERPPSPVNGHRVAKQQPNQLALNKQRARSNSPKKTFSYLANDGQNLRVWKERHRQLSKQREYDRIYYENKLKLERLAKIASEPSSYPSVHFEQERQRQRHEDDYRRKRIKNLLLIYQDNYRIVKRLANVTGVHDTKEMDRDFKRHLKILDEKAASKQKVREIEARRPFILPKIHTKS